MPANITQVSETASSSVAPADKFSLEMIGETIPFDRLLCAGVLIYLNDNEVVDALDCMERSMAKKFRAVFREPMGMKRRLTIRDRRLFDRLGPDVQRYLSHTK